ncbi:hypothetical protein M153_11200021404 [Pseudoloma neurophilia]|uniref:Uncharacterized protein n=1 Tax=Pseudoloma neurophilia TaxID=146866 RepID=A0A0R0M0A7_9MICR|nr:hypothetical protein M153_11200021404 [Pseudoloma neurophilia]
MLFFGLFSFIPTSRSANAQSPVNLSQGGSVDPKQSLKNYTNDSLDFNMLQVFLCAGTTQDFFKGFLPKYVDSYDENVIKNEMKESNLFFKEGVDYLNADIFRSADFSLEWDGIFTVDLHIYLYSPHFISALNQSLQETRYSAIQMWLNLLNIKKSHNQSNNEFLSLLKEKFAHYCLYLLGNPDVKYNLFYIDQWPGNFENDPIFSKIFNFPAIFDHTSDMTEHSIDYTVRQNANNCNMSIPDLRGKIIRSYNYKVFTFGTMYSEKFILNKKKELVPKDRELNNSETIPSCFSLYYMPQAEHMTRYLKIGDRKFQAFAMTIRTNSVSLFFHKSFAEIKWSPDSDDFILLLDKNHQLSRENLYDLQKRHAINVYYSEIV